MRRSALQKAECRRAFADTVDAAVHRRAGSDENLVKEDIAEQFRRKMVLHPVETRAAPGNTPDVLLFGRSTLAVRTDYLGTAKTPPPLLRAAIQDERLSVPPDPEDFRGLQNSHTRSDGGTQEHVIELPARDSIGRKIKGEAEGVPPPGKKGKACNRIRIQSQKIGFKTQFLQRCDDFVGKEFATECFAGKTAFLQEADRGTRAGKKHSGCRTRGSAPDHADFVPVIHGLRLGRR